jgi:hypothetical protein
MVVCGEKRALAASMASLVAFLERDSMMGKLVVDESRRIVDRV